MQALHGQGVPIGTPIRYRSPAEGPWRAGETVKIDHSELTFLGDTPLELQADVEVILPAGVQVTGRESSLHLLCSGRVVRRFLANWPDLRSALVVRISRCRIAPDPAYGEAAADDS